MRRERRTNAGARLVQGLEQEGSKVGEAFSAKLGAATGVLMHKWTSGLSGNDGLNAVVQLLCHPPRPSGEYVRRENEKICF